MKRIVILILTLIACSLVILICAGIREDTTKGEIMAEMQSRLETLARKTDTITASEYTPFIWTTGYSYDHPMSLEEFHTLIEDKMAEYLMPNEKEYREFFLFNDNMAFDTRIMRANNWTFWYKGKFLPHTELNIYNYIGGISINIFKDEKEKKGKEEFLENLNNEGEQ